jgi:hypothetical protein
MNEKQHHETLGGRTMYHVEKFIPEDCPACRHKFLKEGEDWVRLLGEIVDGEKRIRETNGYLIIQCTKCNNFTAQIPLESYQVFSREKAEKLVNEQGFVNLITVTAFGTHAREMHAVHAPRPGTKVMSIKADDVE